MRILKWIGMILVLLVVAGFGAFSYARSMALAKLATHYDIKVDPLPLPFPLSEHELAELKAQRSAAHEATLAAAKAEASKAEAIKDPAAGAGAQPAAAVPSELAFDPLAGVDLNALALERAMARGQHYLESRAACRECHGQDFGGKIVIDSPVMGKWVAPNITKGGRTKDYKSEDWVRIIRHGVKPDGTAATMPSRDMTWFSDQEISDIAVYISAQPAIDHEMEPTVFGPIFSLLIAKGEIPISAEVIDHTTPREKYPPALVADLELGKHLGTTCEGCHGAGLSGGKVQGGDPSWPPAKNLTFDATGLASWSLEDFEKALRSGVSKDGTKIRAPMPINYTSQLKDVELEALYLYFKSVPAKPFGNH